MRVRCSGAFLFAVFGLLLARFHAITPSLGWDELYEETGTIDAARGFQVIKHIPLGVLAPAQAAARAKERLGVRASDVMDQFPELVYVREQGEMSVDQDALFAHMLGAVQELHQRLQLLQKDAQQAMAEAVEYSVHAAQTMEEAARRDRQILEVRIRTSSANTSVDALQLKMENSRASGHQHRSNLRLRSDALQVLFQQHSSSLQQAIYEHEALLVNLSSESAERMLTDTKRMESSFLESSLELAAVGFQQEVELLRFQSNSSIYGVRAAIEAQFAVENENLDLNIRLTQEQAKRDREIWQTAAVAASGIFRDWTIELTSNPRTLLAIVASIFGIVATTQVVLDAVAFGREFLQLKLSQPSVVRQRNVGHSRAARMRCKDVQDFASQFAQCGIILQDQQADHLATVAQSISVRCAKNLPLPHILIHGGAGTGKSKVSEALAAATNMESVTIVGGDISPLGNAAAMQLQNLMSWARRGSNGKVIIVEEAEALLETRTNSPSEAVVGCLTTILAGTGELHTNYLFIFCTSQPEMLDAAIYDRVDFVIGLDNPQSSERSRMARFLMDEVLLKPGTEPRSWWQETLPRIDVSGMNVDDALGYLIQKSAGWSCRDMHKVFLAAQACAHIQPGCTLTMKAFKEVVDLKYKELERLKSINAASR